MFFILIFLQGWLFLLYDLRCMGGQRGWFPAEEIRSQCQISYTKVRVKKDKDRKVLIDSSMVESFAILEIALSVV